MLKWGTVNTTKRVLLAIEDDIAEIIHDKLLEMEPFNNTSKWEFDIVHHSDALETMESPDVVVLSRFLPGDKPRNILAAVKALFPDTHAVLLVGENNQQAAQYIKTAKGLGFDNIVTGELPGDIPYTIDKAIQYTYNQIISGSIINVDTGSSLVPIKKKGYVVGVIGGKGGIGKTTVTAALSIGLSKFADVLAIDADFSGQYLSTFLDTKAVIGMDQFDPDLSPAMLNNAICPVKRYSKLKMLPCSGQKLDIYWPTPDEMDNILDMASENADLLIVDTPSDLCCVHLPGVLQRSDLIVVVIDQTIFLERDIISYGEWLAFHGVPKEKVVMVVNNYSQKEKPYKAIVKSFANGFGSIVPVVATIPHDREKFVKAAYKHEIPDIDEKISPWHSLFDEVARRTHMTMTFEAENDKSKKKGFLDIFKRQAS